MDLSESEYLDILSVFSEGFDYLKPPEMASFPENTKNAQHFPFSGILSPIPVA